MAQKVSPETEQMATGLMLPITYALVHRLEEEFGDNGEVHDVYQNEREFVFKAVAQACENIYRHLENEYLLRQAGVNRSEE